MHQDEIFITEFCEEGSVRLGNSGTPSNGRVEVCIELTWTTICEDSWDDKDASVVCNQLGFSPHGNYIS